MCGKFLRSRMRWWGLNLRLGVRGQSDWPGPASKAGSQWWHPPFHLRGHTRRRENRNTERKNDGFETFGGKKSSRFEKFVNKEWGGGGGMRQTQDRESNRGQREGLWESSVKGQKSLLDKQKNIWTERLNEKQTYSKHRSANRGQQWNLQAKRSSLKSR